MNRITKKVVSRILLFICVSVSSYTAASGLCEKVPTSNQVPAFQQCSAVPILGKNENLFSVAVRNAPPFVYEEYSAATGKRQLKGIGIDLWEKVAEGLEIEFQYVCLGLSDTLNALEQGEIDIAISPLTITKAREKAFDFSHQYFNSGLVFASTPAESNFDFDKAFTTFSSAFASKNVLYLLAIFSFLFLILILFSIKNIKHYQAMPIMKDKSRPEMVLHVVLYSLLNISGIRKDVFGFSSMWMQLFSFIILIFGITVSTSLFGMVTASLTQSVSPQNDFSLSKIDQYSVATLRGSTAQGFLCNSESDPASLTLTDTWEESLLQVANGEKDIVLGDWVQLVYLSQKSNLKDRVSVHGHSFQFEPYGWGLKENHPIKDEVNQELIGLLRNQVGADIVRRYIGNEQLSLQAH